MTGLRLWDRDPSLPLAAGDRELRAPTEEQVAGWVAERRGHDRNVWVVPNGVDPELFYPGRDPRREPLPEPPSQVRDNRSGR